MMLGPLINSSSPIAGPFQFAFIVLLHGRGTFFNFNPRRLLQHQSSLPSTSILVANFIPRHQLQPSSPSTSTLVAFHIPNPVIFLFPPLLLHARGVVDAATSR
jgi:hypothetical protein